MNMKQRAFISICMMGLVACGQIFGMSYIAMPLRLAGKAAVSCGSVAGRYVLPEASKKNIAAATVAAVVVSGATIRALQNRVGIRAIEKKRKPEHFLLGDNKNRMTRFHNWSLDKWSTVQEMKRNQKAVILQLQTDISQANNGFNFDQDRVTWHDVRVKILAEQQAVFDDMKMLEKQYLTYFDYCPSLYDSFGIERRYNAACKKAGISKDSSGTYARPDTWSDQQRKAMEALMPNEVFSHKNGLLRKAQYVFKPNFYKAAQLWWQLVKIYSRLQALCDSVEKLNAGTLSLRVKDKLPESAINKFNQQIIVTQR